MKRFMLLLLALPSVALADPAYGPGAFPVTELVTLASSGGSSGGSIQSYKQAALPTNPTVPFAFCTDCNAAIQDQSFPTPGIVVTWNGSAWTDANGFPTWTGNFNPGTGINTSVAATKLTVNYDLEEGGFENVYGSIGLQNQAFMQGNQSNTLSTIKGLSSLPESAFMWCHDCRGPAQAASKGTGRWLYKDSTGAWLDFASGAAATN